MSNRYWNDTTENSINEFVSNSDLSKRERDRIYTDQLYQPIDTMISAIIRSFRFFGTEYRYDLKDLKADVHVKVYKVLEDSRKTDKYYDPARKSSFSYFSVVIKFYLIHKQRSNDNTIVPIEEAPEPYYDPEEERFDAAGFLNQFTAYVKEHLHYYFNDAENRQIVREIIKALEDRTDWVDTRHSRLMLKEHSALPERKIDANYAYAKHKLNLLYRRLRDTFENEDGIDSKQTFNIFEQK